MNKWNTKKLAVTKLIINFKYRYIQACAQWWMCVVVPVDLQVEEKKADFLPDKSAGEQVDMFIWNDF